jgi:hypothetical protein
MSRDDRASEADVADSPGDVGNDVGETPWLKLEVSGDGSVVPALSGTLAASGVTGAVEVGVKASEMRDTRLSR